MQCTSKTTFPDVAYLSQGYDVHGILLKVNGNTPGAIMNGVMSLTHFVEMYKMMSDNLYSLLAIRTVCFIQVPWKIREIEIARGHGVISLSITTWNYHYAVSIQ